MSRKEAPPQPKGVRSVAEQPPRSGSEVLVEPWKGSLGDVIGLFELLLLQVGGKDWMSPGRPDERFREDGLEGPLDFFLMK